MSRSFVSHQGRPTREQQVNEILDEMDCEREIDALCIREDKVILVQAKTLKEWQ